MNLEKGLPIVTGILGVILGAGTFGLTGWAEAEKQLEINKFERLVAFSEAAWSSDIDSGSDDYVRKISGLTVFADERVLRELTSYTKSNCAASEDVTYECQANWASVVNAMRSAVGQPELDENLIIETLWGDPGQD